MKKDGFYAERIRPIVVMAIMTIICITVISGIYLSTKERVDANEGLVLNKAILYAAGVNIPVENGDLNNLYENRVKEKEDWFEIFDEKGDIKSYAFITTGPGLWGEIEAMTAFSPDFSEMSGIDFIKQNETPGLGGRITEEWFKEQLRGKTLPLTMVSEGTSTGKNEIDAITGASRTSEYVLQILTLAGEKAGKLKKEVNR